MTVGDIISDKKSITADKSMEIKESREEIHKALENLTPVQKDILVTRYLSGNKTKLSTVGKKWKISGERVRQIEVVALRKMRSKLKNRVNFEMG